MKRIHLLYLLMAVLIMLLSACKKGGEFRVQNNCSYPAYVRVESEDTVTIPANASYTFKIDTDRQTIFTGTIERSIAVQIIGETFSLYDEDTGQYTDETNVIITAGKTLEAYLNPNRACVKILNNSSQTITAAEVWQHANATHTRVGVLTNIQPGESSFLRVTYSTPGAPLYYTVAIPVTGGDTIFYGDATRILGKDEQWLVTHPDPQ